MLDAADRIAIVSHHRPDGDAIGSSVALLDALAGRGKTARAFVLDPLPVRYRRLVEGDELVLWDADTHAATLAEADAIVVLDTSSWVQLQAVEAHLKEAADRLIIVDHHVTREQIGRLRLTDPTAAAAGLILHDWLTEIGWSLSPRGRAGLFAAVATDTGWFRFANTDARVLRLAAELTEQGVQPHQLYEDIYWSESVARIALAAHVLAGLDLRCDHRLAIMELSQDAFAQCNAEPSDSENLINEPMRIGSVVVSVLLVEQPDGQVRVSLRSKGRVDVAEVAASLGGGGHTRAAGASLSGPMSDARSKIVEILEPAVTGSG